MKVGFVVNSLETENPLYTTVRLAMNANRMGHETWLIGVDDFSQRADGSIAARARAAIPLAAAPPRCGRDPRMRCT